MKNKLLIVCGPTAVGKTSLALSLAEKFEGELVSADSRQVYKGMDIGTGKDIPKDAQWKMINEKIGYYEVQGTSIWGYDLVGPKEEFSVAKYEAISGKIIKNIHSRGKLPILVGGTGLYVRAVVDGIETAHIPPDSSLREKYSDTSAQKLFQLLEKKDPKKAEKLNESDRGNPHRLIRALEISEYKDQKSEIRNRKKQVKSAYDTLLVGLELSRDELNDRIKRRVQKRLDQGFGEEVESLLQSGITWDSKAMTSLGYRQWRDYVERSKEKEEVINEWIKEEKRYAKRQMTWFKKDRRIKWFDVTKKHYKEKVEELVEKWHNKEN